MNALSSGTCSSGRLLPSSWWPAAQSTEWGRAPPPTGAGAALVQGHISWPDCPRPAANCPPVDGVPIHFADAADNRTFTATSDGSGKYSIQLPSGSYTVIAGNADRSPYQRPVAVKRGDVITLDLLISLPTGLAG